MMMMMLMAKQYKKYAESAKNVLEHTSFEIDHQFFLLFSFVQEFLLQINAKKSISTQYLVQGFNHHFFA